jgi:hypothetical protein
MKKRLLFIIIGILFIGTSGCSKHDSYFEIENADSVTIYYGVSNYAYYSTDEEIIYSISDNLNSLSFKKTDHNMNVSSMFTISLSRDKESLAFVCVDGKGVFFIDNTANCYEVNSGSFDYAYIQDIYEKGRRSKS